MRLTAIVHVPVKVEFYIPDGKEVPEVGTITHPTSKEVEKQILVCLDDDYKAYPYYANLGKVGRYTILQRRY